MEDKLLLLSQINIDESNSDDESEIFNTKQLASSNRTSTTTDLASLTLNTLHTPLESDSTMPEKDNSWFKYLLLMSNFCLNGIAFGLFLFSREYYTGQFKIEDQMSTNVVVVLMVAFVVGLCGANLVVGKMNRFHFGFVTSLMSAGCMIGIVNVGNVSGLLIFTSIFGLCMGFSTTIAFKWCLNLNEPKQAQNFQTNLLQLFALAGMIAFFCLLAPNSAHSLHSTSNQSMTDIEKLSQISSTTPKVHLKKPEISDGSFLEQNRVTKPTTIAGRKKRQFILPMTTNPSTRSTTTKFHLPKPEVADGKFLDQSHITKPIANGLITPATQDVYDAACLKTLERKCVFKVDKCRLDDDLSDSVATNLTAIDCEYTYIPTDPIQILVPTQTTDPTCINLPQSQLTQNDTISPVEDEMSNCFADVPISLQSLIQNDKSIDYKCILDKTEGGIVNSRRICSGLQSCQYIIPTATSDCILTKKSLKETTTSTSTTTTTTTSTTTSTKASTTKIDTSAITTNLTNNTIDNQYTLSNFLSKTSQMFNYKTEFDRLYLILSMAYLCLASLHMLYLLTLIKTIFLSLLTTIKFIVCCCRKNASNVSYHRANSGGDIPLLSLQEPYKQSSKLRNSDNYPTQQITRNFGVWLLMLVYFLYGGVLLNFLIFMPSYLRTNLVGPELQKVDFVFKFFLVSFLIGRVSILLMMGGGSRDGLGYEHSVKKRTLNAFLMDNYRIYVALGLLCVVSIFQAYDPDHLDVGVIRRNVSLSEIIPASVSTSITTQLTNKTMLVYGLIYPFLLSTLTPQIFNLFQRYQEDLTSISGIHSRLTLCIHQSGSIGAILISLANNYLIFGLFNNTRVFVFSNLIQLFLMFILMVLFVYACGPQKLGSTKRKFVTFNDMQIVDENANNEDDDE